MKPEQEVVTIDEEKAKKEKVKLVYDFKYYLERNGE